jgi:hypothetical protein
VAAVTGDTDAPSKWLRVATGCIVSHSICLPYRYAARRAAGALPRQSPPLTPGQRRRQAPPYPRWLMGPLIVRTVSDDSRLIRLGLVEGPLNCASRLERVTGIEPALSAWEAVPSGPVTWPDLRRGVSASDRERPPVTGVNGPLMARRTAVWSVLLAVPWPSLASSIAAIPRARVAVSRLAKRPRAAWP